MDKQGIVLKTEYDAKAAFPTPYMGEQERRFFHALCYAVEARFRGIRYKSLAASDTRPESRL